VLLAIREDFRLTYIDAHFISLYKSIPLISPLLKPYNGLPFSVSCTSYILAS
jgi:hypothetical protein